MLTCTRVRLVPFAFVAMGVLSCLLTGCRKESEQPALPSNSPAVYMKDPVFRKAVADRRKELQAIAAERKPLADRMQELVREHGEDLAALQGIPEWTNLYERVTALNRRYEEAQRSQLKLVKERLGAPKKDISK